jgi:hypothetical protein
VALTRAHRARAYAILFGEHGADADHTLAAGRFHRAHAGLPLEAVEANVIERAAQVVIGGATPTEGYRNPLTGRDLSTYPLVVRIAYFLTAEGDESIDATGEASGAGTLGAIEDRAAMDFQAVRDCIGWQPSWAGLDPVVIDCAPDGEPSQIVADDRVIYEQTFALMTRATLHTSYAPPL